MRQGSIAQSDLAKRHDPATIARLETGLASIATQIAIGPDIAARHPGVSALGMQRLLDVFRNYEGDVENPLPAAVDSQDSYDRFVTIMRRINQYLFPAFMPEAARSFPTKPASTVSRGSVFYFTDRYDVFELHSLNS